MNDLISRQAAIDAINTYIGNFDAIDANFLDGLKTAKTLMMQLPSAEPAIEAEPVRRGRWIRISPARIYECSICGQNIMAKYIDCYKFCFGCGAKMDGGGDDGNG